MQQGARASVVLLDPGTFDGLGEAKLPTDELAALGVVSYVVNAQSDISLMLGPSGIVGDEKPERHVMGVR
jgi:hypothetical protein